jgi:hypothetical protein
MGDRICNIKHIGENKVINLNKNRYCGFSSALNAILKTEL